MNEKDFFMPGFEKNEAIKKWKEFHRQVNGNMKEYLKPVEYFHFKINGKRSMEIVNGESEINGKLIIAIVQSDNGMVVYTHDSNNIIKSHLIKEYNRESYNCFKEI